MNQQQLMLFNYDSLDHDSGIVVQQRATEIKDLLRTTAENIVRIGEKLVEVRGRLPSGQFNDWIEYEFSWSRRSAYNFINVYERFGGERANFAQLNIATSALYQLAAPSTPAEAVNEIMDRAEEGERIDMATTKEVVTRHKSEKASKAAELPAPPSPGDQLEMMYNKAMRYALRRGKATILDLERETAIGWITSATHCSRKTAEEVISHLEAEAENTQAIDIVEPGPEAEDEERWAERWAAAEQFMQDMAGGEVPQAVPAPQVEVEPISMLGTDPERDIAWSLDDAAATFTLAPRELPAPPSPSGFSIWRITVTISGEKAYYTAKQEGSSKSIPELRQCQLADFGDELMKLISR